jgi:uncharacterized phage protein (predicted DNA packaging)
LAILDDMKKALRISISTTAFDSEVTDLIATAKLDLQEAGIIESKANDDTDPLIKQAIKTYCKANFGWNNPEAERLQKSYDLLKMSLSLMEDYNTEAVV